MFVRRRTFQRRGAGGFSRFRRRRGPRLPRETVRYERANFWQTFIFQIDNTSDTSFNLALLLASAQNVGDRGTTQGRALAQQVRGVEVNGIVLNYYIEPVEQSWSLDSGFAANPVNNEIYARYGLYTDRLTTAGAPVGLTGARWQDSESPASQVTTTLPPGSSEDTDFPLRVLWHRQEFVGFSGRFFAGTFPEGAVAGIDGQRVRTNKCSQINKRLKLFLTDNFGLFWCWSFVTGAGYGVSGPRNYRVHISGSLYHRVRY